MTTTNHSSNNHNFNETPFARGVDRGSQDYQKYFNKVDPGYMKKFDLVSRVDQNDLTKRNADLVEQALKTRHLLAIPKNKIKGKKVPRTSILATANSNSVKSGKKMGVIGKIAKIVNRKEDLAGNDLPPPDRLMIEQLETILNDTSVDSQGEVLGEILMQNPLQTHL